ncbi:MAG: hypothetical protein ACOX78_03065 [Lachnospiraceae bacterium]
MHRNTLFGSYGPNWKLIAYLFDAVYFEQPEYVNQTMWDSESVCVFNPQILQFQFGN